MESNLHHFRTTLFGSLVLFFSLAACEKNDPAEQPSTESEAAVETLAQPSKPNAIRFLEQSSFGPNANRVAHVMSIGIDAAIDEQLSARRTKYSITSTHSLGAQFYEHAAMKPDQLRQRVAFALSQIIVVSQNPFRGLDDRGQAALATYLDLLSKHAFGDFKTLIRDISVNPAMGYFLDQANNHAFLPNGDADTPNENYARELLQLFTLGLYLLNDDGTEKVDAEGKPRLSYTQEQVEAFARTLTGWTYHSESGCPGSGRSNPREWTRPMIGCNDSHDRSSQRLLRGTRTTEGAGAETHLDEAIENIVSHENVAPFISKQLIQHLVTSNPTRGYVRRITTVFRDDGTGHAGNLGAVVRAILEDSEARGARPPSDLASTFGHLRSPSLFITNVVRRLNGQVLDGSALDDWGASMGQGVPRPPSVFSYYPPSHPLPGSETLLGPEFAVMDTATSFARANFLTRALFKTIDGVTFDLEVMPADPDDMITWLDVELLHGTMTAESKMIVRAAIVDPRVPPESARALGLYLTALTPEFQVQR
jgi:uncharacterized protein (DUF1800 family)